MEETERAVHPRPESIRRAMDALEPLCDVVSIDMKEGGVYRSLDCGTVCCHAGAYMLACGSNPKWVSEGTDGQENGGRDVLWFIDPLRQTRPTYAFGAQMLAQDLGFRDSVEMEHWANDYPEAWGNENGILMFASTLAFRPMGEGVTLRHIVNHWRGVADRIEALER